MFFMRSDFRSVLIVRSTISFSTSGFSTEVEFNEVEDEVEDVFIQYSSVVEPMHIFMARSRVSKSC